MKKFFLLLVLAILVVFIYMYTMNQNISLKVGDKVPVFTLRDQNNTEVNIAMLLGKKPMVIYFYPKDDTPGCTKEACSFRDEFEAFTDLNVEVIGISSDDAESHKKFAEKYNLPFTLLADTQKEVRKLFGVPDALLGLIPGRVTYVVNKDGIITHIFNSRFNAKKHVTKSLAVLKELNNDKD